MIAEVIISGAAAAGKTLGALDLDGCIPVGRRDRQLFVPDATTMLCEGDTLTLLGSERAVSAARAALLSASRAET